MERLSKEPFSSEISECMNARNFWSTKKKSSGETKLSDLQIEMLQKLKEKSGKILYYGEWALSKTMESYYDIIEAASDEEIQKVWNEFEEFVKKQNDEYFKNMTFHAKKESESSS